VGIANDVILYELARHRLGLGVRHLVHDRDDWYARSAGGMSGRAKCQGERMIVNHQEREYLRSAMAESIVAELGDVDVVKVILARLAQRRKQRLAVMMDATVCDTVIGE